MRKILIILTILSVVMVGCAPSTPPTSLPEEPADTAGEKTVLYCGSKTFPLSFTVDGKQQIENGTYWYYELSSEYGREWEDSFYTYSENLELNGSRSFGNFGKKCRFATNGDWALFLSPVHTEFNAENQDKVDKSLRTLAQKQLDSNTAQKAEVTVTDLWQCDLDGDKTQEQIFYATDEKTYCFIGYVKGDSCLVFDGEFLAKEGNSLPNVTPIVCDPNGDGAWSLLLHKKGDYESVTLYDYAAGNFTKCYDVIF